MVVVQCWDDGVTTDARLADILRRHGARATFNLCAGLHEKHRSFGWIYQDTEVFRLGWNEVRDVYAGFTIANHGLTHQRLDQVDMDTARHEIVQGREVLQQYFRQSVRGFAWPFGAYNEGGMDLVREAGHVYARTAESSDYPWPPENAMAFHPSCHFLAPDLWERYEQAKKRGVFYFWGHSYEMTRDAMWIDFEKIVERITADRESCWGEVADLFDGTVCREQG
jgi:peptidoglycan/xylan/chitin deacetylase (PgdA/CDA1 family)